MIYTCTIAGVAFGLSSFRWHFKHDAACQLSAELPGAQNLTHGEEVILTRAGIEIARVVLDSYTTQDDAERLNTSIIASDTLTFTPLPGTYEIENIVYRSSGQAKGLWLYRVGWIEPALTPGSTVNYLDHTFLIDSIVYDVGENREHMEIREAVGAA